MSRRNVDPLLRAMRDKCSAAKANARTYARVKAWGKPIAFDLTADHLLQLWIRQGGCCTCCGQSMTHVGIAGHNGRTSGVSVDRIDPDYNIGYVAGNVQLMRYECNLSKNNLTMEQFKAKIRRQYRYLFG
jgi:hypothetical protein